MKEKITFPTLVANLAIRSGKSKKQCEDFLRELFAKIEQTLASGESLKIKGLGTFKIVKVDARKSVDVNTGESIEIPSHNKVTFIPAKELSDQVNAPFSMFESVEISEQDSNKQEDELIYSNPITDNDDSTIEEESLNEVTVTDKPEQISTQEEIDVERPDEYTMQEGVELTEYEEGKPKKHRFLIGFLSGIACSILLLGIGGWICYNYCDNVHQLFTKNTDLTKAQPTTDISATESIATEKSLSAVNISDTSTSEDTVKDMNGEMVPTQASDNVVYDTITRTRYLTTMAKEHYGNYNLWPYIYIENQKILGHPDRIRPGTRVVVPSLSKYKVYPNNKKDIEKAKQMGIDIYARYQ